MTLDRHPAIRSLVAPAALLALSALSPPLLAQDERPCGTALSATDVARVRQMTLMGGYVPPDLFGVHRTYVVPVTLHVVRRSDGSGGISPQHLEESYHDAAAALAPGKLELCRPGPVDYIDDDVFYDCVCGGDIDVLRSTNYVPDTINIYFVPRLEAEGGLALCGVSSYSFEPMGGIVVQNDCTAQSGNRSTVAHEIGHYFDLYHTHETIFGVECADGSNCELDGDLVCDTPADPGLSWLNVNVQCEYTGAATPACPGDTALYAPDPSNHMSYGRSACRTRFTPGQVARMRATLVNLRPELALSSCDDPGSAPAPGMSLVSATPAGTAAEDGWSARAALSRDGRFVAFESNAQTLTGATFTWTQIHVRDLETGAVELVSLSSAGEPSAGACRHPSLSADGRYVAFATTGRLVPQDIGNGFDVYLRDRATGTTELVSALPGGGGANLGQVSTVEISGDGRYVAFDATGTSLYPHGGPTFRYHVYLADRATGAIELIDRSDAGEVGDHHAKSPDLSDDGRYVVFDSYADNLDPADATGGQDVYLRDRALGTTRVISGDEHGVQGLGSASSPTMTPDGRRVVFVLRAAGPFAGDLTGSDKHDVVVKDLVTGELILASVRQSGGQSTGDGNLPAISDDGRWVVFGSDGADLLSPQVEMHAPQIFLRDLELGATLLASPVLGSDVASGECKWAAIDGAGLRVAFQSTATDLVAQDENGYEDVFLLDLQGACAIPAEPFCFGSKGAPCPCKNLGGAGEGCASSSGRGAKLAAQGSICVADASLAFSVEGAGSGGVGFLLEGAEFLPVPLRDGIACVGGGTRVVAVLALDSQGDGAAQLGLAGSGARPGLTRAYQLWYRDAAGPCGSGANLSQALRVRWR